MTHDYTRRDVTRGLGAALLTPSLATVPATVAFAQAPSGEPIKIGFGMALTGPLAANGKQALLGAKIWEEADQQEGRPARPAGQAHLLRRPDQARRPCPASTPSCSTSTNVDLVVGPYATHRSRRPCRS